MSINIYIGENVAINNLEKPVDQRWSGDEYFYYRSGASFPEIGKLENINTNISIIENTNIVLLPDGKVMIKLKFSVLSNVSGEFIIANISIPTNKNGLYFYNALRTDSMGMGGEGKVIRITDNKLSIISVPIANGDIIQSQSMIYIPGAS